MYFIPGLKYQVWSLAKLHGRSIKQESGEKKIPGQTRDSVFGLLEWCYA
jgi:hypothetical protein